MKIYSDLEEFWGQFMSLAFGDDISGAESSFRGVSDSTYELIPSLGRSTEGGTNGKIHTLEDDLINEFKRLSIPELLKVPENSFEWIILAQHYGLPTRLLDWSSNPLVALFFAVEKNDNKNGAIYHTKSAVTDQYELFDYRTANYNENIQRTVSSRIAIQPNQGEVIFIRPKYKDRRYQNQRSIFSCHANPYKALDLSNIEKIEFKGSLKPQLRERLRKMGISTSFIYPGLDGIAAEVKSFYFDPITAGRKQILTVEMKLDVDAIVKGT